MTASKGPDWSKIAKIAGLLGSVHDGERLAALRVLDQLLKGNGLTWADLVQRLGAGSSPAAGFWRPPPPPPPPPPRQEPPRSSRIDLYPMWQGGLFLVWAEIEAKTPKALLLVMSHRPYTEDWVPLSQIERRPPTCEVGIRNEFGLTRWIVQKKGLEARA